MPERPFIKHLQARLFPVLRSEGFKGSGATLRRYAPPVLHVFNIQKSSSETHCYLNLGAHLDFLPTAGEGRCVPETIKESECVFRDRIVPPPGPAFGWVYQVDAKDIEESVEFILSEWSRVGRTFFARYSEYPRQFVELVRAALGTETHPMDALVLGRIAVHLNLRTEAEQLVSEALPTVSPAATGLKRNLERLVTGPAA